MTNSKQDQPFMDVIYQKDPCHSICYRSGLMVYEEALVEGIFIASAWNGSGFPLAVVDNPEPTRLKLDQFPAPQAFLVDMDGQPLVSHWEWDGIEQERDDKGLHVMIRLKHKVRPVTVIIHTTLDGTPILKRSIEIINTGNQIAAISQLAPMSGPVAGTSRWTDYVGNKASPYLLGYMEQTNWGKEGSFQWHRLPNAGYRVSGRYLRERHRHPMFVLKNEATGEIHICQFAWSGGYSFAFDLDTHSGSAGQPALLSFSVSVDAPGTIRTVSPGESVMSPEVHIGMLFGGLDDAINAMHEHVRKSVIRPQARGRGCWVEAGVGPENDMSEENTLRLVEEAASLGAEVFFLDAGWYTPPGKEGAEWHPRAGDWYPDPARYQNGLTTIRDRVKSKGMLFGLWMDSERIGSLSQAAKDHPDWIASNYTGRSTQGKGDLLDLTNPAAASWMENQIARVLEDYQLDFYRLDYNLSGRDAVCCTVRNGYVEDNYLRYYDALYRIYDRLRDRFPTVIFEACAGGGGRTDLGLVSRFCHTWVTDWPHSPRSFMITNGMTMALPPEHVDRLIAGQGLISGSLDFQMRQLLFVRFTIGPGLHPKGSSMNLKQTAFIRHSIDLYKQFIRPFMPESRIFHHTPVFAGIEPDGWGILELSSVDSTRGILGVFQLANPQEAQTIICLRGVDVSKQYRVTWDNSRRTAILDGSALAGEGVRIRLEGPCTSELLLYESID